MRMQCVTITAWLSVAVMTTCAAVPTLIGQFSVPKPAFIAFYPYSNGSGADLLVDSFNAVPFEKDNVYRVTHVETKLSNPALISPQLLSDSLLWPNQLSGVPESIFQKRLVAVPGGFLVPLKTKGAITLLDPSLAAPGNAVEVTEQGADWFYHKVQWRDMDQDGDMDILTCRADKPIFGSTKAELLWLENAGSLTQGVPWKSHILAQGPDIFFDEVKLAVPGAPQPLSAVFVAQFFSPALGVYWVDNSGDWSAGHQVLHRDIDTSIGPVFDVTVCDVNQDGRQDLLVSTNSATNGTVLVYEIPDDFRTGVFKRHLLASKFASRTTGMGKGSPGAVQLVFPTNQKNSTRPSIILSGDDGGQAFTLTPRSEAKDDWTYSVTPFLDVGSGTVGGIAVYNGTMFVPAYNQDKVYVYRI